jgi:hypothetical protein
MLWKINVINLIINPMKLTQLRRLCLWEASESLMNSALPLKKSGHYFLGF